jgi:hypothetical protein
MRGGSYLRITRRRRTRRVINTESGGLNGRVIIRALNEIEAVGAARRLDDHCGRFEAVY